MNFKNTRQINKSITPFADRTVTPENYSKCTHKIIQIPMDKPHMANHMLMDHHSKSLMKVLQSAHTTIDQEARIEMMS